MSIGRFFSTRGGLGLPGNQTAPREFPGRPRRIERFVTLLLLDGRCWTRTSDPIDVSDVLYQLS